MKLLTKYESAWADTREHLIIAETGEWRYNRPVVDQPKCRQCGWCYLYCPTGCVKIEKDGYFAADLNNCKGCGICAQECPAQAITMVAEDEGE